MKTVIAAPAVCVLIAGACAIPIQSGSQSPTARDAAAVNAVVEQFHAALAAADSTAALALLAPDAVILESGALESRAEYRAHHLPADIAFARAVSTKREKAEVTLRRDVAWVTSTSTARGQFRNRPVNSSGAELMVLVRSPVGWRIAAIHWSSRALRD